MANAPDPWFVTERSEALAKILLTRHADVHIRSGRQLDDRLILHVEIDAGDPVLSATQVFVVQVKGTMSADPDELMRGVKQLFPGPGSPIYMPVCVFVVNVRENTAFYAWAAEPQAEVNKRVLHFPQPPKFHPLDSAAISEIVGRVKAWYAALPKQLVPA